MSPGFPASGHIEIPKKSFIIQKEGYLFVSEAITKYDGSAQL